MLCPVRSASVPGLHLLGSRGRLESVSRDASIFHRQKGVRRGLQVGLGVARDRVLRAHVVEVDEGSIADDLSVLTGEGLLTEGLRSQRRVLPTYSGFLLLAWKVFINMVTFVLSFLGSSSSLPEVQDDKDHKSKQ